MTSSITQPLAQQIVSTVKDVCGQDINFIDQSGIIFASTDQKRIGTYHEIGYKAFHTDTAIQVENDNRFTGTQRGINLPVRHNNEVLAVIGISGDPEEVKKYAHLAERITRLLIREQEVYAVSRNQEDKKHFIIHSLIGRQKADKEYLTQYLEEFKIDVTKEKRLILIRLDYRFHPGNASMMEGKLRQLFESARLSLYTFDYPNEYLAVMDQDAFQKYSFAFRQFASDYQELLKIAVGKSCSVYKLSASYQSALTAWKSISSGPESFVLFDDLTLEIILSAVDEETREEFLQKTISALSEDEISLMRVYFEHGMSLSKTCECLFLHKNTLQYRLNHIYQKCGLNPRRFQDALVLCLAVILHSKVTFL